MYTICKDFHFCAISLSFFFFTHSWTHVRNVSALNDSFAYQKIYFYYQIRCFSSLLLVRFGFLCRLSYDALMMSRGDLKGREVRTLKQISRRFQKFKLCLFCCRQQNLLNQKQNLLILKSPLVSKKYFPLSKNPVQHFISIHILILTKSVANRPKRISEKFLSTSKTFHVYCLKNLPN